MESLTKESSRLFVFTDLDDTLFRSYKTDIPEFSIPATVDTNGKVYSYSSIQQQKLLDVMVQAGAVIIPVTGRRSRSFLNCQLPIIIKSEYAIVSHGALIMNENHQLLDDWYDFLELKFELTHWKQALTDIYEKLLEHYSYLDNGVRVRLIVDQGITCYICIKISKDNYNHDKSVQVNQFLSSVLKKEMSLHSNGRNFAILPPYAQKKVAVDFLKEKLGVTSHDTVLSMGDSHSDLPFMSCSDFLIVPQNSQIFEKGKSIMKELLVGSYSQDDCLFLLKKIKPDFYTIKDKEKLIQSGKLHYSQMVSQESKPSSEYEKLFLSLTAKHKQQLANEIMQLSYLISRNIKHNVCLVSLVRAGTPIGVLVNKAINQFSPLNSVHYSLSIVRDKGIDVNALDYLLHDLNIAPESIVFIDGWTAKGIITKELKHAIHSYNKSRHVNISDDLYVVSDIGGTADYSATLNDYTIPSALMNSTVSGLISRSVINDQISKDDFHGCISYKHLEKYDYSNWFVNEVSACFSAQQFKGEGLISDEQRTLRYEQTQHYISLMMHEYNVSDINRIKPGIAEATRVMLRRVPDLLLVKSKENPNTEHLIQIANEKNIALIELPEMPFGACALIKDVGQL